MFSLALINYNTPRIISCLVLIISNVIRSFYLLIVSIIPLSSSVIYSLLNLIEVLLAIFNRYSRSFYRKKYFIYYVSLIKIKFRVTFIFNNTVTILF